MGLTACLLAVLFVTPAAGTEAELERLRAALELPKGAVLRIAPSGALRAAPSFKVGLATALDTKVRDNLTRWIEEWNRKDGARQGRLELVPETSGADVVLVRLLDEDKARSTTQTFVTGATTRSGVARPERRSFTVYQAPVRAYVLRTVPGGFEIVWRLVGFAPIDQTDGSGRDLWNAFSKLLKAKP